MISLSKGNYLDQVDRLVEGEQLIATQSTYHGDPLQSRMHFHDNTHMTFVLAGGYSERRKGGVNEILPGKFAFYHAGEEHQSLETRGKSKNINLEIDQSFFTADAFSENALHTATTRNPDINFLFLRIYRELQADDSSSAASINMLLFDIVNKASAINHRRPPVWLDRITQLLHDQWDQQLTLRQLSAIAGAHPVTVSRQFHQYHSCTLGEYMRKLRIEKAITMIKSPRPPSLTRIALDCGFADQSHFTRTFRKLTGFLPHHYRKL